MTPPHPSPPPESSALLPEPWVGSGPGWWCSNPASISVSQVLKSPLLPCLARDPQELPQLPTPHSFRKNFGFGEQAQERAQAAFRVIQTEHKLLGPMSFAEKAVSVLFVTLVVLWFTREPGFFLGWGNLAFPDKDGNR